MPTSALSHQLMPKYMKYLITDSEEFNLYKALNGDTIGFVSSTDSKHYAVYVTNFQPTGNANESRAYRGFNDGSKKWEYFNSSGMSIAGNQLSMIVGEVPATSDTGGTRGDETEGVSYDISSLLPKDVIAMNILNGIISRMTMTELQTFDYAKINQLSQLSYLFAQSMINTAAANRNELGKTTTTEGEEGGSETTTRGDDANIVAIMSITDAVKALGKTDEKPLHVKVQGIEGGSSSGSTEISTAEGKPIEANLKDTVKVITAPNSHIDCIFDVQSQDERGPIPIKLVGGAIGQEFRNSDETVKEMPSIVKFVNEACSLSYDSDSKTLTISIENAGSKYAGLLSASLYRDLIDVVGIVGIDYPKFAGVDYDTLQSVLDEIDNRLKALET